MPVSTYPGTAFTFGSFGRCVLVSKQRPNRWSSPGGVHPDDFTPPGHAGPLASTGWHLLGAPGIPRQAEWGAATSHPGPGECWPGWTPLEQMNACTRSVHTSRRCTRKFVREGHRHCSAHAPRAGPGALSRCCLSLSAAALPTTSRRRRRRRRRRTWLRRREAIPKPSPRRLHVRV